MVHLSKKILPKADHVKQYPFVNKFIKYFHYPGMWQLTQQSAARATAAGLFAAAIPLMPFQMIIAIVVAILIRGNCPLALAVCWVSNPLTLLPITYFTCYVGNLIMGTSESKIQTIVQNFIWGLSGPHDYWTAFMTWIQQFGKAFLVGLPFVAIGSAVLGYIGVTLVWKASVYMHARWNK